MDPSAVDQDGAARGRLRTGARAARHCGALLVLTGAQLAMTAAVALSLVLMCVGAWFLFVPAMRWVHRVANEHRRSAQRWSGVEVPNPYGPRPDPPLPGPDGRYQHGATLYRRRWWPRFLGDMAWLNQDRATARDLLWLVTNPFVALPLVLLAPVLVVAGLCGIVLPLLGQRAWPGPGWTAPALGVLLVLLAPVLLPRLMTWHARWTRVLLAPEPARAAVRSEARLRWCRDRAYALSRPLILAVESVAGFVAGAGALLALLLTGALGSLLLRRIRPWTELHRRQAFHWSGVHVPSPYRPAPEPPAQRPDGRYESGRRLYATPVVPALRLRARATASDPATWRDLLFLLAAPLLAVPPLLCTALFAAGICCAWVLPWTDRLAGGLPLWVDIPLGYAIALLAAALSAPVLRAHATWTRLLLGPTAAEATARRGREVVAARPESTWTESAELRRIERDLHDGAQARLGAIGMALSNVEYLIDRDPAKAKQIAADARETSAAALVELRSLVRSIYPPVLSERGLGDALRALAIDLPLTTHLTVELPGSVEPPVESAVYFAGAELLNNALRHGDAAHAWVDLRHERDALTLSVVDDGCGGADFDGGTGLRGIERRLAAFTGTLRVTSPAGGPTRAVIHVPCLLQPPSD